jgi:hypothetical protein
MTRCWTFPLDVQLLAHVLRGQHIASHRLLQGKQYLQLEGKGTALQAGNQAGRLCFLLQH